MRFLPAILVFGLAGAGYYATHSESARHALTESWLSTDDALDADTGAALAPDLAAAPAEQIVAVPGPEQSDFGSLFRFDLTPESVAHRWARVTTGLSDMGLQGYRVPLVTGTAANDIAGSLTYYFDGQPRLRSITFLGSTGDPARLVNFLARHFGFRKSPSASARTKQYHVRYGFTGFLTVEPAVVLDRSQPRANYKLTLRLSR
jgi:hypothetical protein